LLQIISGRFFGDGTVEEKEQDAILYSNVSWPFPLETQPVVMRPCDLPGKSISSYVLRFKNRYERQLNDTILLAPADQAVDQFRMLCALWFRAYFHEDRAHVEHLCRLSARGSHDTHVPRHFVSRVFDSGQFIDPDVAKCFPDFVAKVLCMPREKYRLLMSCLETYLDSLEALGTNFDLAYSMMVYVLEALSQNDDGYVPVWIDYDDKVRSTLDEELCKIDAGVAEKIRGTLLESSHLKLMKRFVTFTTGLVSDEFFIDEPKSFGVTNALQRSKLERALKNLYSQRSGYVHQLRNVRDQLRLPNVWLGTDVFEWNHEPYFTYSGLVRFVRHILMNFVARQPKLTREVYPAWRDELPGLFQMEIVPKYWIWNAQNFTAETASLYLAGFLEHLDSLGSETRKTIPNLDAIMNVIETLAKNSKQEHRRSMLSLYWFYNHIISEAKRRPNYDSFLNQYKEIINECSVEIMIIYCYTRINSPQWPASSCALAYEAYEKARFKPKNLLLPRKVEVSVMAFVANRFLDEKDEINYNQWVEKAILDASGLPEVQAILKEAKTVSSLVDIGRILGRSSMSSAKEPTEELPEACSTRSSFDGPTDPQGSSGLTPTTSS